MKPIARRALIGLLCGIVSSFFLCFTLRSVGLGLALGALLGIAQIFAFFDLEGGSAIDRAMTSAALGLPFWATINVILLPAQYFLGPESPPRVPSHPKKETHVVILGGGFAGVTTAEHLEKQFRDDPTVSFTLISETNSWLFTPMLVEVATSGLEPTHISTPLRTSLKRTRVLRSRVTSIDLECRRIGVNDEGPHAGLYL
jgi:NADH:ubiquinone reductase (H+-translocating)